MILIKPEHDFHEYGLRLTAGVGYVCEHVSAAGHLALGRPHLESLDPYGILPRLVPGMDPEPEEILITRPGGIGDILFLTPLLRAIRAEWPRARLTLCTIDTYRPILEGSGLVDSFRDYPMIASSFAEYDAHLWLEGIIELDDVGRRLHYLDILEQVSGLRFAAKELSYEVDLFERQWAAEHFGPMPGERRRVGLQVFSSAACRSMPTDLTTELCKRLIDAGWSVFLFGAPGQIKGADNPPKVINLSGQHRLKIRESCAVLATCDAFIGPDSALVHIAGALGVPTVGVYGPFPWQLRTAHAASIRGINGTARCAPCYYHGRRGPWPPDGPCAKTGRCEAMHSITPEQVLRQLEKIAS